MRWRVRWSESLKELGRGRQKWDIVRNRNSNSNRRERQRERGRERVTGIGGMWVTRHKNLMNTQQ